MEAALNSFLQAHKLEEIVAGAPLDFSAIPVVKRERVLVILMHCCVNGPVSPHIETNFPIIGKTSLDGECGFRVTNGTVRSTCEQVKQWLQTQGFVAGFMYQKQGELWPNGYLAK